MILQTGMDNGCLSVAACARGDIREPGALFPSLARRAPPFGGRDPDAGKHHDQAGDQIGRNRLADQPVGKERGGDWIDRDGARHARRCRPLQGQDPEHERERTAKHAEIDASDPLRRAEASEHGDAIGQAAKRNKRDGATTHPNG